MLERLHLIPHLAEYHNGYFERYIESPDIDELRKILHEQRNKINEIIDYLNGLEETNGKIR